MFKISKVPFSEIKRSFGNWIAIGLKKVGIGQQRDGKVSGAIKEALEKQLATN